MSWKFLAVAVIAVQAAAGSALAQGVASSVPMINGTERARHVFSIPGVSANTVVGTFVMCTSLEKSKSMSIAVEVMSEGPTVTAINDITAGEGVYTPLAPGETATFELTNDGLDLVWSNHDSLVNLGTVLHASARVVSTSKKLMCAAGVADRTNSPPSVLMPLPVISKTKQRGV